jgi:phosphopantetheine adenylyltransferase
MALMNRRQNNVSRRPFLMPDERYTYLSSSLVREIRGSRACARARAADCRNGAAKTSIDKPLDSC